MDCHFLLQGIFPTQGSNPGLPHCRQMLYHLSHQGSPYGEGGGTLQTISLHVWEVFTVYGPYCVCPSSQWCVLSQSIMLRLQVALQGTCLKQALGFMHFPGLSCIGSGFGYSTKERTDSAGHAFCAPLRSKQLRRPGAWKAHTPQVGGASYHLPGPSLSVSWVRSGSAVSGVPCVSSGELISGCNPPGRCQPSRIPGRIG